jgi:hypothetical protein
MEFTCDYFLFPHSDWPLRYSFPYPAFTPALSRERKSWPEEAGAWRWRQKGAEIFP